MKNTLRFLAGNAGSPACVVQSNFRHLRLLGECGVSLRSLVALVLLAMSVSSVAHAQANAGASAATRYIEALQKGDFKTVINLSYGYQGEVAQIKAQNPQVLWPKLTTEYYDAKIATLASKPGFWEACMQGMMGDPAQQIRFMQSLLLPNVKWKVTETRSDDVQDSIQFGGYDRTIVYITVNYLTLNDSPFVDGKFIKETILEFDLNTKSQLVMTLGRLPQADTPWDAPLMIMNTSWQLQQVPFANTFDGHPRAEAIGGQGALHVDGQMRFLRSFKEPDQTRRFRADYRSAERALSSGRSGRRRTRLSPAVSSTTPRPCIFHTASRSAERTTLSISFRSG